MREWVGGCVGACVIGWVDERWREGYAVVKHDSNCPPGVPEGHKGYYEEETSRGEETRKGVYVSVYMYLYMTREYICYYGIGSIRVSSD